MPLQSPELGLWREGKPLNVSGAEGSPFHCANRQSRMSSPSKRRKTSSASVLSDVGCLIEGFSAPTGVLYSIRRPSLVVSLMTGWRNRKLAIIEPVSDSTFRFSVWDLFHGKKNNTVFVHRISLETDAAFLNRTILTACRKLMRASDYDVCVYRFRVHLTEAMAKADYESLCKRIAENRGDEYTRYEDGQYESQRFPKFIPDAFESLGIKNPPSYAINGITRVKEGHFELLKRISIAQCVVYDFYKQKDVQKRNRNRADDEFSDLCEVEWKEFAEGHVTLLPRLTERVRME